MLSFVFSNTNKLHRFSSHQQQQLQVVTSCTKRVASSFCASSSSSNKNKNSILISNIISQQQQQQQHSFATSSLVAGGLFKQSLLFRATGTVQQWNSTAGFGFVIDDETKKRIYFPFREVIFDLNNNNNNSNLALERSGNGMTTSSSNGCHLVANQRVRYETISDPSRKDHALMCIKVRDISGKPISSPSSSSSMSSATIRGRNNTNNMISNRNLVAANHHQSRSNNNTSSSSPRANIFGRNLAGNVTQLEGGIGMIMGTTDQLRQHGQFLFSIRKDFRGNNSNNGSSGYRNRNNFSNHSNSFSSSSNFLRIGDRVIFDIISDPQRVGKTRITNVRKDQMMSGSF